MTRVSPTIRGRSGDIGRIEKRPRPVARDAGVVIVGVPGWAPPLTRVLVVAIVVVVVAVPLVLAWAGQRKLIYFPDRRWPPPPGRLLPSAVEVPYDTADGLRLGAWFVAAGGRPARRPSRGACRRPQ
jgi:hypothetical protein